MRLFNIILVKLICTVSSSPNNLQLSTYKSTMGIQQDSFDDNLIEEVGMPPSLNLAMCGGLCSARSNCGVFTLANNVCRLADASGMKNDGTGNMQNVFVNIVETRILVANNDTTTASTTTVAPTTTTLPPVPCSWQTDQFGMNDIGMTYNVPGENYNRDTCLQACISRGDGRNAAAIHRATGTCYCYKDVQRSQYNLGYDFKFIGNVGSAC